MLTSLILIITLSGIYFLFLFAVEENKTQIGYMLALAPNDARIQNWRI